MQLLATTSFEYGEHDGLDWISGNIKKIDGKDKQLRLPHMGWNEIKKKPRFILTKNLGDKAIFYFVHSYRFLPTDKNVVSSIVNYGGEIVSSLESENIFGAQFHPEKSHDDGFIILKNFINYENLNVKN